MKNTDVKTDLACEWRGCESDRSQRGVRVKTQTVSGIRVQSVEVSAGEGERQVGRPAGEYVTVFSDKFWLTAREEYEALCAVLAERIRSLADGVLPHRSAELPRILVAGLGNRFVTADALGPLTVDRLIATRHIRTNARLFQAVGSCEISLIAPGVVGQTGFEAAEMIRAAAECAKPDLILVIDALAARSCQRLGTTVQLSNRGVMPGSGVGNHRKSIDHHSMGAPVFTFGIPTVVSSAALIREAVAEAGLDSDAEARIGELAEAEECFVSPKNCDTIVAEGATLFADAIQQAFRL